MLEELKLTDEEISVKLRAIFCQHCKAIQKTSGMLVKCWWNPLRELKAKGEYNAGWPDILVIVGKSLKMENGDAGWIVFIPDEEA
jgi:hypothetical protein